MNIVTDTKYVFELPSGKTFTVIDREVADWLNAKEDPVAVMRINPDMGVHITADFGCTLSPGDEFFLVRKHAK